MLIDFSVANYRSIKTQQSLSLVKGTGKELEENFSESENSLPNVLKSAAIYGANGAGKSNIIMALNTMQSIVLHSATRGQANDKLPLTPFLLDKQSSFLPSEFEVVIYTEGVRYQYGFTATENKVLEEWLFAFPHGRSQTLFQRAWDHKDLSYKWTFGKNLTGQKALWQQSTRDNALFLSTGVQLNSKDMRPVYDWFSNSLRICGIEGWDHEFTAKMCQNEERKSKIVQFLKNAAVDVSDVKVQPSKFKVNLDELPAEMPDEIKKQVIDEFRDKEFLEIKFSHLNSDGGYTDLEFNDESDGTQKLFSLIGPWFDVLDKGRVIVVDELNNSLHPSLVRALVDLFHSSKTNPSDAQLVFTTHDSSIMASNTFRRDQLWFCEKDIEGTTLYPLTKFSIRSREMHDLNKIYLSGKLGAVPFIKNDIFI
ncbi:ATP-binding protein [Vreelandella aquamarina]|uniref:AAA family ATPase n=1 Tax=Vreelandella aquamarina TaxID=77097 RepID=UPI00384EBCFF